MGCQCLRCCTVSEQSTDLCVDCCKYIAEAPSSGLLSFYDCRRRGWLGRRTL